MTTLTPEERGEQAERLLPYAAQLIALVHGDGDARDIQQFLARINPADLAALLVDVAALADPDRPLTEALGWINFDERERPAQSVTVVGSIRDLAATTDAMPDRQSRASVIVEDTAELAAQGLTRGAITARLGIGWSAVTMAHSRSGRPVPELAA